MFQYPDRISSINNYATEAILQIELRMNNDPVTTACGTKPNPTRHSFRKLTTKKADIGGCGNPTRLATEKPELLFKMPASP